MKAVFILALVAILSCASGNAILMAEDAKPQNQASSPAHDAKIQDIKKLLSIQNSQELMNKTLDNTIEAMMKSMPPGQAEHMDAFFTAFRLEFNIEAMLAKLNEAMIPIFDKNFTHDEIKALIAFQTSPVGQKLIKLQPDIQVASMSASMEMAQTAAKKAMASLRPSPPQPAQPKQ